MECNIAIDRYRTAKGFDEINNTYYLTIFGGLPVPDTEEWLFVRIRAYIRRSEIPTVPSQFPSMKTLRFQHNEKVSSQFLQMENRSLDRSKLVFHTAKVKVNFWFRFLHKTKFEQLIKIIRQIWIRTDTWNAN